MLFTVSNGVPAGGSRPVPLVGVDARTRPTCISAVHGRRDGGRGGRVAWRRWGGVSNRTPRSAPKTTNAPGGPVDCAEAAPGRQATSVNHDTAHTSVRRETLTNVAPFILE
jgi:hypothetical protein